MPKIFNEERQADYEAMARRVGNQVRIARIEKGWTQEELARKVGRVTSWVGQLETGRHMLNLMDLVKIASLTGYPLEFFTGVRLDGANILHPQSEQDWQSLFPERPDWAAAFWQMHQALMSSVDTRLPPRPFRPRQAAGSR